MLSASSGGVKSCTQIGWESGADDSIISQELHSTFVSDLYSFEFKSCFDWAKNET
jgi:hypothetical protein